MKRTLLTNSLGWTGVVLVISAYTLLSFGIIPAGYLFQIATLLGSLAVAAEAWLKKDAQPAILNAIFACIALLAIIRILFLH